MLNLKEAYKLGKEYVKVRDEHRSIVDKIEKLLDLDDDLKLKYNDEIDSLRKEKEILYSRLSEICIQANKMNALEYAAYVWGEEFFPKL